MATAKPIQKKIYIIVLTLPVASQKGDLTHKKPVPPDPIGSLLE